MDNFFNYHNFLEVVVNEDIRRIKEKEATYKGSWKKSGGRSAYFMLQRKMDRFPILMIVRQYKNGSTPSPLDLQREHDIFGKIEESPLGDDGTILAEMRDLRAYLILVEAEMMARGVVPSHKYEKDDESLHVQQSEYRSVDTNGIVWSVERLDKNKGYSPGNYQFVSELPAGPYRKDAPWDKINKATGKPNVVYSCKECHCHPCTCDGA